MIGNSSEILLRRFQDGSEYAPFEIHERYTSRVISLVRRKLSGQLAAKFDAEDISQETFNAFFDAAKSNSVQWQQQGDLWRFLAGIAINKLRQKFDHFRREKRQVDLEVAVGDWQPVSAASFEEAGVSLAELVDDLLQSERPFMKTLLRYRLAGYSQAEIAEKMGRSPRTIRRMLESLRLTIVSRSVETCGNFAKSANSSILAPKKLDYRDFQLLRMLGQGSFARVYLAKRISTGEMFALKTLKRKWLNNLQVTRLLKNEFETIAKLNDPNVVKTFGVGELPNGSVFLLLELVQGERLDVAARRAEFVLRSKWLKQIVQTIERIHAAGIVHGDIRPSNIFVNKNSGVKLLDFGFSSSIANAKQQTSDDLKAVDEIREYLKL